MVDSRNLAPEDTAPVSTSVDPGCSETTGVKPQTTQGFGGDEGRNMPESPLDRGCKEALVFSVGYSAATNASGTAYLLSPTGKGTSQTSGKPDSRALSAGFSATHPIVTAKPGHGSAVLAGGVWEQPRSSGLPGPWLADNHRSRSVGSTYRGLCNVSVDYYKGNLM